MNNLTIHSLLNCQPPPKYIEPTEAEIEQAYKVDQSKEGASSTDHNSYDDFRSK